MPKPLNNVTHFDLDFRDSKGNALYFADKDVIIDFTLKMIQTSLPITNIDDFKTPCNNDDLHSQISELMKIV